MLDGAMSADEVLSAANHLQQCVWCRNSAKAVAPAAEFMFAPVDGPEHVDVETMVAYRDGKLEASEREIVETHLEDCATCREDFAEPEEPARRRWTGWAIAAAAVVAVVGETLFFESNREVAVTPRAPVTHLVSRTRISGYERADWAALVASTEETKRLPQRSDADEWRSRPDQLRGAVDAPAVWLTPVGTAVDTTRPEFRWPASSEASYVVSLESTHSDRVRRSPVLHTNMWIPDFDLERGVTYQWQVAVSDGTSFVIPAPPAPAALFHVLERERHDEIESANRQYPNDHLLLAVLDAKNGLHADCLRELKQLGADPARTLLADALIQSMNTPRSD